MTGSGALITTSCAPRAGATANRSGLAKGSGAGCPGRAPDRGWARRARASPGCPGHCRWRAARRSPAACGPRDPRGRDPSRCRSVGRRGGQAAARPRGAVGSDDRPMAGERIDADFGHGPGRVDARASNVGPAPSRGGKTDVRFRGGRSTRRRPCANPSPLPTPQEHRHRASAAPRPPPPPPPPPTPYPPPPRLAHHHVLDPGVEEHVAVRGVSGARVERPGGELGGERDALRVQLARPDVGLDQQLGGQAAAAVAGRHGHAPELDLAAVGQQAAGADNRAVVDDDEVQRVVVEPVELLLEATPCSTQKTS